MSMSKGPCGPAVELRKIACGKHSITYIFVCPSYRGTLSPLSHMRVVRSRRKCRCKAHLCDSAPNLRVPTMRTAIRLLGPEHFNPDPSATERRNTACERREAEHAFEHMRLVVGSGPFSFARCAVGSCRDDGTPPVTRTKMSFDTAQRRVRQKTAHDVSVVRASFYVSTRG
jgi:hypothetical protein